MAVTDREMQQRVRNASLGCEAWPAATGVEYYWDQRVAIARFPDIDRFHPRLVERVLELEDDEQLAQRYDSHVGGGKIYDLERWNCPEADLIYFRALMFFREITRCPTAAADASWATTYRRGDYCCPHSHLRAMVSIVYFLSVEQGGSDAGGLFRIADPRVAMSCRQQAGVMTTPAGPTHADGIMVLFPGEVVHYVEPYWSDEPRITLAWNVNPQPLAEPDTTMQATSRRSSASAAGSPNEPA